MNPLRTLLIHLKSRRYSGSFQTIVRYLKVKSWKYSNKTVYLSIRDRDELHLIMQPGCAVSEKLYVVGLYDYDGMTTLENILQKGDVLYDVGANIGPFSLLAHSRGASVYAFEGHPKTAERCRVNYVINGIDPARVIASAVSDFDGSVSFSGAAGSSINKILDGVGISDVVHSIEVPAISLDTFSTNHEPPSAIKIDTEGHELHVFKGMQTTLKNHCLKYITFEANGLSSRAELTEIHGILLNAGFIVGIIDWDQKEILQKSDLGDKSPTGDYIAISNSWIYLFNKLGFSVINSPVSG